MQPEAGADSAASIRPRLVNRGDVRRVLYRLPELLAASIRPRLVNRGDVAGNARRPRRNKASIRPRLVNRGDANSRSRRGPNPTPRRFNSATVGEPWRQLQRTAADVKTTIGASIRPRLVNRGDMRISDFSAEQIKASIRPRLVNRGDTARCWARSSGRTASIRPRLVNRGDLADEHLHGASDYELQFGHGW
ncbi:unnamed protein product [Gemmata massiliana]|uniref:Uncharacterized protein n=1 Tax=Gemmata massiliana TaxID=1210884 RepID=A0A6P2DHE6_9BACT|nr:unnamed protein product [Gemmata massiliana]